MNVDGFRQLSAGHALHALSSDEERDLMQALAAHPEWQSIVDADLETAAELGDAVPDATPSEGIRSALLNLIDHTPQIPASNVPNQTLSSSHEVDESSATESNDRETPPAHTSRRRALWAGAFALAASLVVFTTITLSTQFFSSTEQEDPATVTLTEVTQATDARAQTVDVQGGGEATLHWSLALDQAVFVVKDLPKLPSNEDFEVWLVRGDTPISVGVLKSIDQPTILDGFQPGDVVAVTVEQAGGSNSGAPTSDPILAITTA